MEQETKRINNRCNQRNQYVQNNVQEEKKKKQEMGKRGSNRVIIQHNTDAYYYKFFGVDCQRSA